MKKSIWLFLLLISSIASGQVLINWETNLGTPVDESSCCLVETQNGGFLAAGNTGPGFASLNNPDQPTSLFIKLDSTGQVEWQRQYRDYYNPGSFADQVVGLVATSDGGFVAAGVQYFTYLDEEDELKLERDYRIMKLDSLGNLLWERTYGYEDYYEDAENSYENLHMLINTNDGGFMVTGSFSWTLKLDATGQMEWQRQYEESAFPAATLYQIAGGDYIIVSAKEGEEIIDDRPFPGPDCLSVPSAFNLTSTVRRLTPSGEVVWSRDLEPLSNFFNRGWIADMKQDKFGELLLLGYGYNRFCVQRFSPNDAWIVKMDVNGNFLWEKKFGGSGSENFSSGIITPEGGYVFTGSSNSVDGDVGDNFGNRDAWVVKTTAAGQLIWEYNFGGSGNDYLGEVLLTTDQTYFFAGTSTSSDFDVSSNFGGQDIWLLELIDRPYAFEHFQSFPQNGRFAQRTSLGAFNGGDRRDTVYEVCADGMAASLFKIRSTLAEADTWNLRIAEDPVGSNPARYGTLEELVRSPDSLVFRYTHPQYQVSSTSPYDSLKIQIVQIQDNAVIDEYQLNVWRAPVLMVHGVWSNRGAFEKMETELITTAAYDRTQLFRADYQPTNDRSFLINREVVPDGIDVLIAKQIEQNRASGGVDLVVHSMGGLLTRTYLQSINYREDIHKFISCNTPYSGSQGANLLLDQNSLFFSAGVCRLLENPLGDCYEGAVGDLRVDSDAIRKMNKPLPAGELNRNKVPAHAIITHASVSEIVGIPEVVVNNGVFIKRLLPNPAGNILPFLLTPLYFFNQFADDLFNQEPHDVIVSNSSQSGGLSVDHRTIIEGQWHVGSVENGAVIQRAIELLGLPPGSGVFALDGFTPIENLYSNPIPLVPTAAAKSTNNFIEIQSPPAGANFHPGDTVILEISGSTNITDIVALLELEADRIYRAEEKGNSAKFAFIVDSLKMGRRTIISTGFDATDNTLQTDQTYINIIPAGALESISIEPGALVLQQGDRRQLNITGKFSNSGLTAAITSLPGLRYTFSSGRAEYLGNGQIGALEFGADQLQVTYQGVSSPAIPINILKPALCFLAPQLDIPENNIPTDRYQASQQITSSGKIAAGSEVLFQAGQEISLRAGFWASAGSFFHAEINPCPGTPEPPVDIPPLSGQSSANNSVTDHFRYDVEAINPAVLGAPTDKNFYRQKGAYALSSFPNPFARRVTVQFHLASAERVNMTIYNLHGNKIDQILDHALFTEGQHQVTLEKELPRGIYLLELLTENYHHTIKIVSLGDGK